MWLFLNEQSLQGQCKSYAEAEMAIQTFLRTARTLLNAPNPARLDCEWLTQRDGLDVGELLAGEIWTVTPTMVS